jgi:CRISPR-associated protein Cmr6
MNGRRFKVEGKVWFGNKKFYSGNVFGEHDKEDEAKKEFFDKAWELAKMNNMESLSLLFQKYIPFIDEAKIQERKKNGGTKTENWLNFKDEPISGDSKKLFLDKIVRYQVLYGKIKKFSDLFKKRVDIQKENLKNQQYEIILDDYQLKTASRLVVGLGAGHVFETSLTLHHIFGIPYIPASALKGVVRMVSFWEIAGKLNKKSDNEIEELQKQLYDDKEISDDNDKEILKHKLLFGTQNFKGLLVFLDAYPEIQDNQQIFELDVMTPHYQGYYTKNQVPGDWENPNPIVFLTVKKGITFCFNVLFDKYRAEKILEDKDFPQNAKDIIENWGKKGYSNLSSDVKKWLKDALTEFGIGAKTRLGYGIFD